MPWFAHPLAMTVSPSGWDSLHMAVGLANKGKLIFVPNILTCVLMVVESMRNLGLIQILPNSFVLASWVMQSVAADEKNAQAFAERFSEAARAKSWVLSKLLRGRRSGFKLDPEAAAGPSSFGLMTLAAPGLDVSKSPIRLAEPSSLATRDGAWMLLYSSEASKPAWA
jgi:hypothetical protein